jgi:hypothetical protein
MTSVEEFNLRLSATKDVLVGLQQSGLPLVFLGEDELRVRARSLVSFLAGANAFGTTPPPWLDDVANSAEDYLTDCLRSSMDADHSAAIATPPPRGGPASPKSHRWWRFWV